jgi:NADH-quinone oxidoreductase subunit F
VQRYVLRNIENSDSSEITEYEKIGGYGCLRKALSMEPQAITGEVRKSGLRGRGGAGFPTHMKWSFAASDPEFPKYLICNADEGEPGTFKDKLIIERNPHQLIEGMAIAARALNTEQGFVYLKGEYTTAAGILEKAIKQAYERGYLGRNIMGSGEKFDLLLHKSAGAYICGEETALINSLEGRRGHPRIRPPFPVNAGYRSKPTVVNNAETLANIPVIFEIGWKAYSSIGSGECPGPKLFSISGDVEKPGVYELPMGTNLKDLIYRHAGGLKGNKPLKAVIPGGVSTPVLPADKVDCPMDYDSMRKCGSMLGSGGVIAMDHTRCMVRVCMRIARFFEHESCGKCTPCREGTGWMSEVLHRIEHGRGQADDLDLLLEVAGNIAGKTFCPLGDSAALVVRNFIGHFREEFEDHINEGRCVITEPPVRYDL